VKRKLKEIMSVVFNESIEEIKPDCSFEKFEKWDSLAHLNLIIAIEESFNIKLSNEEVEEAASFNSIIEILRNKNIT
tara:strand:+ start:128 stop:358 length:231 start_codon:yes stop_codon:yes gene_type:complete